jgi:proteasome lid subunit RPN8/RPN11
MAEKHDRIDVNQLAGCELAEAPFPGGGKKPFRVFFDSQVHERILAHAGEKKSLEICGILVGRWQRDADGPFVLVSESIRCDKAVSNAGDVTFSHEAWNDINREMDTRFTELRIVGWYHSHPNYGIFLSDRDCFVHEHFFDNPGHVAHVVDPVHGIEGVFTWRKGKLKLCPHFWVGDEIHLSSEGASQRESSSSPDSRPATPPKPETPPLVSPGLLWTLTVVCLVMLAYYIGNTKSAWEQRMVVEGVVAHYGLWKGLRPGLRERLNTVDENLQKITQFVDTHAKEHVAVAGDAAEETKAKWAEANDALRKTRLDIRAINQQYSLSPEENAMVEKMILAKQAELEALRARDEKTESAAGGAADKPSGEKPSQGKPANEKPAAEKSAAAAKVGGQPAPKPVEAKSKPSDSGTKPVETHPPEKKTS